MTDRELTMKPPLFVKEWIRNLESELMFARTAPYWIPTMRPGDMAYQMTEMMLNRLKKEQFYDTI